jgi:hypothetical protein
MSEIANKGRVRVWTMVSRPDYRWWHELPEDTTEEGARSVGYPVIEMAALPDLKNLLTELADDWTNEAHDELTERTRALSEKDTEAALLHYECARTLRYAASELRHLITEQLGEER